jgi:hypothetical protein
MTKKNITAISILLIILLIAIGIGIAIGNVRKNIGSTALGLSLHGNLALHQLHEDSASLLLPTALHGDGLAELHASLHALAPQLHEGLASAETVLSEGAGATLEPLKMNV